MTISEAVVIISAVGGAGILVSLVGVISIRRRKTLQDLAPERIARASRCVVTSAEGARFKSDAQLVGGQYVSRVQDAFGRGSATRASGRPQRLRVDGVT